ncbi:FbpB family small basic protein [Bacillus salacetis]|uniref:FbpB family small basic protein n=1 Tax=Bacillus salacetis TaxID=2315464 RepID=A0A3A1R5Q4_9BACI|nr:FbpB family small basic protein [Bacillus salacetis]RIW38479.1 FbpB family small basic protein [Bacillus salacetis]
MKRGQLSIYELVKRNKEEMLRDKEFINKIEVKIEENHLKKTK